MIEIVWLGRFNIAQLGVSVLEVLTVDLYSHSNVYFNPTESLSL